MSPTRRQVVSAIAAGSVVPATVTAATAQEDGDQEFSPDITFNSNNLVATIGERDGDGDPDTVTIYTADGSAHEFDGAAEDDWEAGQAFDVGYTHDDSRARIDSWHGTLERVTATKDGETVSETNDGESTLEVSCSLWKTPDEPPTEFTALSEGARKQHWNRGDQDLSEDQRQYGSPGRPLWTVAERSPEIEMRVDFLDCEPETEKALWFDCTSVTVTEDELNQGEERIEDVQLTYDDDTTEHPPGTADEADNGAYELPVTLSGSGENDGKVIKKLHFKVDRGEYTYWNLEADQCSSEQDAGGDGDSGGDDGGDGSDGGADGQSAEETETPSDDGPSSDDDSDEPTQTPDDSDDGSGSAGGDGGGTSEGGSGGSQGSDGSSGGGTAADGGGGGEDTETATPQSVEVGTGTTDAGEEVATEGAGTAEATATENGSAGAGEATTAGGNGPRVTEGVTGEDQPGMGFVSAFGGLLGLGELARRRLGADGPGTDEPDAGDDLDR